MKKRCIFNKIIIALFIIACSFIAVSCGNISSLENEELRGAASVRIVLGDESRTIMPATLEMSEFKNFKIVCKCNEINGREFEKKYTSIDELCTGGVWFYTEDIGKSWTLTLYAYKEVRNNSDTEVIYETRYSGTNTIPSLVRGENTINIVLTPYYYSGRNGSFSLTFDFSEDVNKNSVTKVTAELRNENSSASASPSASQIFTDFSTSKSVCFRGEQITCGNYTVTVKFYVQDTEIAIYTEEVHIAGGLTTTATRTVKLNKCYKITYDYNFIAEGQSESRKVIKGEKPSSTQTYIPDARTGYVFAGWYTDTACTNKFALPATEDKTVYASWISETDSNYVTKDTVVAKINELDSTTSPQLHPAEIVLVGEISSSDIMRISQAIVSNSNVYINLDLSKSYGLTTLDNTFAPIGTRLCSFIMSDTITTIKENSFMGNNSMARIRIGKNVKTIEDKTFSTCSALEAIEVDPANNYYKQDENFVLYSKDGKTLISYPQKRSGTSYTIPADVTRIAKQAFGYSSSSLTINFAEPTDWFYTSPSNSKNEYQLFDCLLNNRNVDFSNAENCSKLKQCDSSNTSVIDGKYNFFRPENIEVYNTESLDLSNSEFTITKILKNHCSFYKFSTIAGQSYTVTFADSATTGSLINCPTNFGNASFLISGQAQPSNNASCSFTATSTTTYLVIRNDNTSSDYIKCAFRIWR